MKFLLAAVVVLSGLHVAEATAQQFSVLSYNVRGIPAPLIEDRTVEIAEIAPRLEDYHDAGGLHAGIAAIVELQEVFDPGYYNTLTDPGTVSYAVSTPKDTGGPLGGGGGLTRLSDFQLADFVRVQWQDCFGTGGNSGSDCDTNKGYSYGRHTIDGAVVDVYNLHADAGQDPNSQAARRANITQLVAGINARSAAGTAVIVMGDTNSLYTRTPDDIIDDLRTGAGLTDVWVELVNGGVVPAAGPDNEAGCATDPSGAGCELVDKVFYRGGDDIVLTPASYDALDALFEDVDGNDLSDHFPVSVVFGYQLVGGPTTSSSSTTSTVTTTSMIVTTTTMAPASLCGDPIAIMAGGGLGGPIDGVITATDALFILRAAVGSEVCDVCICDADGSGLVAATDALVALRAATGQQVTLACPACSG
ncbi:MAG: endonuclease/exonuclease/phosphatase family protein [Candidatus Binatia bacterium]